MAAAAMFESTRDRLNAILEAAGLCGGGTKAVGMPLESQSVPTAPDGRPLCKRYMRGRCDKTALTCRYAHLEQDERPICAEYRRTGRCTRTDRTDASYRKRLRAIDRAQENPTCPVLPRTRREEKKIERVERLGIGPVWVVKSSSSSAAAAAAAAAREYVYDDDEEEEMCWLRHGEVLQASDDARVVLQIDSSRFCRAFAYVEEELIGAGCVSSIAGTRKLDCVMFLRDPQKISPEDSERAVLRRVLPDQNLQAVVSRVYRVRAHAKSAERVADAVYHELLRISDARDNAPVSARIRAYPTADTLNAVGKAIKQRADADAAASDHAARISLAPSNYSHVIDVVETRGRWYYAVHPVEDAQHKDMTHDKLEPARLECPILAAGSWAGAAVSRAFWKMHEVLLRANLIKEITSATTCIDVGAAPGGWTQCIAGAMILAAESSPHEHGGSDAVTGKIYAVDRAELTVNPLPSFVDIVPNLLEEALPDIATDVRQRGRDVDMLVCDANVTPAQTTGIVASVIASGILADGCVLILTLKNFCASDVLWERECVAAKKAIHNAVCGSETTDVSADGDNDDRSVEANSTRTHAPSSSIIHLFQNGITETTLVVRCGRKSVFDATGPRALAEELAAYAEQKMEQLAAQPKREKRRTEYDERQRKREEDLLVQQEATEEEAT